MLGLEDREPGHSRPQVLRVIVLAFLYLITTLCKMCSFMHGLNVFVVSAMDDSSAINSDS